MEVAEVSSSPSIHSMQTIKIEIDPIKLEVPPPSEKHRDEESNATTENHFKGNGIRMELVKMKTIEPCLTSNSLLPGEGTETELIIEQKKFKRANLNADQHKIFEYVFKHPTRIITIQAGPGCGKSFTLKTIAYESRKFVNVIIYKHDLLHTFRYAANRYTVAKIMMSIFNLTFYQYTAVELGISSNLTSMEFMVAIVSLLKCSQLGKFAESIVFLDEYTVIPKPLLLILLMLFEYYNIGCICCGDKDQLQNILNSRHAICSSYDIANAFSINSFQLYKNERCSNKVYTGIIEYFAQFSSSKHLDAYAFAMIAAIFPKQCITPRNYFDIHLAATHQELATIQHMMVCENGYDVDFYTIDESRTRDPITNRYRSDVISSIMNPHGIPTKALENYIESMKDGKAPTVEKFLPYVPLVRGARYYIHKHSEYSQGVLTDILDSNTQHQFVARRYDDTLTPDKMLICDQCNSKILDERQTHERSLQCEACLMNIHEVCQPHISSKCKVRVERNNLVEESTLTSSDNKGKLLLMTLDDGSEVVIGKNTKVDKAMFDQHADFLLNNQRGRLYGYPIYPSNFMSIHKCQGCTITENLDLMLEKTTYQGLYVALSRVTDPKQITKVTIPNHASHLISAIINFPELIDPARTPVTIDVLRDRMANNFVHYRINENNNNELKRFGNMIVNFLLSDNIQLKAQYRNEIIMASMNLPQTILKPPTERDGSNDNLITISKIIKYRDIFMALACVDSIDRNVWLHEFVLRTPDMAILIDCSKNSLNKETMSALKLRDSGVFASLIDLNNCYSMNISTVEYIKYHAKVNTRIDAQEQQDFKVVCLEEVSTCNFLESTEFCCKVFHKYRDNKEDELTTSWLIDELNMMLEKKNLTKKVSMPSEIVESSSSSLAQSELTSSEFLTNIFQHSQPKKIIKRECGDNDDNDDDDKSIIKRSLIKRVRRKLF